MHRTDRKVGEQFARTTDVEFDMWVLPVSKFVELTELKSHEELHELGHLVRWDASMRGVFYLSHQWTSRAHPDHTNVQLRSFQKVLLRMMRGDIPETSPNLLDKTNLPKGVNITASAWQHIVPSAYVWCVQTMHIFCVHVAYIIHCACDFFFLWQDGLYLHAPTAGRWCRTFG